MNKDELDGLSCDACGKTFQHKEDFMIVEKGEYGFGINNTVTAKIHDKDECREEVDL